MFPQFLWYPSDLTRLLKLRNRNIAELCPVMKTASVNRRVRPVRAASAGSLSLSPQATPPSRVRARRPHAPPPPHSCLAHLRPLPHLWAHPLLRASLASAFWCPCRGHVAPPANKWRGRTLQLIAEVRYKEKMRKMSILPSQDFWVYKQLLLRPLLSVINLQHFFPHFYLAALVYHLPIDKKKKNHVTSICTGKCGKTDCLKSLVLVLHFIYMFTGTVR